MRAIHLRVDGRITPLGIDEKSPVFRWKCQGGKKQTAYRLRCKEGNSKVLWDSGKVETHCMHCAYQGPTLKSGQRVVWNVTLWDETDRAEESEETWFEMGLLSTEDWKADWICGVDTDKADRLPVDLYKKEFHADSRIFSARLYVTACGVYAVTLNGQRFEWTAASRCACSWFHRI